MGLNIICCFSLWHEFVRQRLPLWLLLSKKITRYEVKVCVNKKEAKMWRIEEKMMKKRANKRKERKKFEQKLWKQRRIERHKKSEIYEILFEWWVKFSSSLSELFISRFPLLFSSLVFEVAHARLIYIYLAVLMYTKVNAKQASLLLCLKHILISIPNEILAPNISTY